MSIKINSFESENVKRIKAVKLEPSANGLTIIGGNNKQGKSSVLDAIAWALGGDSFKPSNPKRNGSVLPPHIKMTLSNGLIVERKGKNSTLKVTDPDGNKAGQQLLNEFVEQLALNLPKFMAANGKDKANTLLKIIGVGDILVELDTKESTLYDERHAIGVIADRKMKFANEMESYTGVPDEIISASELIKAQQEILAKNSENQRKRANLNQLEQKLKEIVEKGNRLKAELDEARKEYAQISEDVKNAKKTASELVDESTAELEKNIAEIDELNVKIRANIEKAKAESEAQEYKKQYVDLTNQIEDIRKQRIDLLKNADLPLPELSVENGEITYKGEKWDNMSGSEQLIVATAIVRKLNPDCGFVLLDKLEQLDLDTLKKFGEWLEKENLQAIATRVSKGDECSIIIEDGCISGEEVPEELIQDETSEFEPIEEDEELPAFLADLED